MIKEFSVKIIPGTNFKLFLLTVFNKMNDSETSPLRAPTPSKDLRSCVHDGQTPHCNWLWAGT